LSAASLGSSCFGEFLDLLASRTPAPGGGAAAAGSAALGIALGEMTIAWSLGRKSLVAHEPAHRAAQDALRAARSKMLVLADEDAAAYARVSALQRLPEGDKGRHSELPAALLHATEVPIEGQRLSCRMLELLAPLRETTNPHLVSDLIAGAVLLEASGRCFALNVLANAPMLGASAAAAAMVRESGELAQRCAAALARIMHEANRPADDPNA